MESNSIYEQKVPVNSNFHVNSKNHVNGFVFPTNQSSDFAPGAERAKQFPVTTLVAGLIATGGLVGFIMVLLFLGATMNGGFEGLGAGDKCTCHLDYDYDLCRNIIGNMCVDYGYAPDYNQDYDHDDYDYYLGDYDYGFDSGDVDNHYYYYYGYDYDYDYDKNVDWILSSKHANTKYPFPDWICTSLFFNL